MTNNSADTLVSICIPTYNGEKWLLECLDSARSQTYPHLEILLVDDVSTDRTVELARSVKDERLRVVVNRKNRGLVGNWNECVRLSKGEHIKFLFQDDVLYPDSVEKMMGMFRRHPELGLVFSPRDVWVEGDVPGEIAREWLNYAKVLHTRFDVEEGVNDGRALFMQHRDKKFQHCCIGEPTTVLIRKECFRRLGLFNPRVRQTCDVEMWLRIMYFYDVGFIDENLCAFRFHVKSATSTNHQHQNHLYDPFWLLEGLLSHDEIRVGHPDIVRMRDDQIARNSLLRPANGWRSVARAGGIREAMDEAASLPRRARFLLTYLAHRWRASANPSQLHEQL